MNETQEIYNKLSKQCPAHYRINELIHFAYPYRELRLPVTVNKSPEESVRRIYTLFLKTLQAGIGKEADFAQFLGIKADDFLLNELHLLRERGLVAILNDNWILTEQGVEFLTDSSGFTVLEEEEISFFVDCVTGDLLPEFRYRHNRNCERVFKTEIDLANKSPYLLENKEEQLSDIYKSQSGGKSTLIDYSADNISFDKKILNDYLLIEYIPVAEKRDTEEAYIEIRNTDKDHTLNRGLSKELAYKYKSIIKEFSDSERIDFAETIEKTDIREKFAKVEIEKDEAVVKELMIWETKQKFKEALSQVKNRILIESPWIKRATVQYLPAIKAALERNVTVYILFGIKENDMHHSDTLSKVRRMAKIYRNLRLIYLPRHFKSLNESKMTGTHRKLLIKDEDYYITGSFNFLSFNRQEGETIANEESTLIRSDVREKWDRVFEEYEIKSDVESNI